MLTRQPGTIIEWDGVDSLGRGLESIACIFLDKIYHRYLSLEEIPFELEILLPKPRVVARLADGSRVSRPWPHWQVALVVD